MARAVESFSHRHENTTVRTEGKLGEELEIFAGRTKILVNTLLSQHRLLRRTSRSAESMPEVSAASESSDDANKTLNGVLEFTPEWFTGMNNSVPSGPVDSFLTNTGDTFEGIWDPQTESALNMEWFSFMEQAGLVDPIVVNSAATETGLE